MIRITPITRAWVATAITPVAMASKLRISILHAGKVRLERNGDCCAMAQFCYV